MSGFARVPVTEKANFTEFRQTLDTIDKLPPVKRKWAGNVMKVLGLNSAGSQGRMLAGAISTAEVIIQDPTRSANDKATAVTLRDTVTKAGTPPWKDTKKALAAGDAKAQLDLLSIPQNQRVLQPLGGGKTANQTFWLNRRDADGQTRKSFLCKPAGNADGQPAPSGGPKGGEVAREALAGRAAQLLMQQTGIDIGMPETHVVELDPTMLPNPPPGGGSVTCSVQEFRESAGDLLTAPPDTLAQMKPEQIAGLAIFDTITLNTDRHSGNALVADDGSLVPIDHGESFVEPTGTGLRRLKTTLGSPHNALLRLPGAHEPMSEEMLAKLRAFDPKKYAKELKSDKSRISRDYDDMKKMISSKAVDTAERSATFVKMAARNDPPLSPAAIQVAMGAATDELFGPDINDSRFKRNAQAAIKRAARHQGTLKEVCTAPNVEYDLLVKKVAALGWEGMTRLTPPDNNGIVDPLLLLTIIKNRIQAPAPDEQPAMLKALSSAKLAQQITPGQAKDVLVENRVGTINALLPLMAPNMAQAISASVRKLLDGSIDKQMKELSVLLGGAIDAAMTTQQARLTKVFADNRIDDLLNGEDLVNPGLAATLTGPANLLRARDPISAAPEIDDLEARAQNNEFVPASSARVLRLLESLADSMMIPSDDVDLVDGLTAANALDPFAAGAARRRLLDRIGAGEFIDGPLANIQAELDTILDEFTIIASQQKFVDAVRAALQARDALAAHKGMEPLRNGARYGTYLPKLDKLDQVAARAGIPAQTPELEEVRAAVQRGDSDAADDAWRTLRGRATDGEFGTAALDAANAALDDLLTRFDIPDTNKLLTSARDEQRNANALALAKCVADLERIAQTGLFPAKNG